MQHSGITKSHPPPDSATRLDAERHSDALDGKAVVTCNADAGGDVVLVCEHASAFVPERYDSLGLAGAAANSHAAWDPGALALALQLSIILDAPLIASGVSRLVHDCNRPPGDASAMPRRTETFEIPGNVNLSPAAVDERVATCYQPFETALHELLDVREASARPTGLVTIHSFTPCWHGVPRAVELGLLHDTDSRLADVMLACADEHTSLNTQRNQPYSSTDGVTWTLQRHALTRAIPNVMIEVRNDLLDVDASIQRVAEQLGAMLAQAVRAVLPRATRAGVR